MVQETIEERQLIATLRSAGVSILTGQAGADIVSFESLIERALDEDTSSRIRSCLVPLFLLHPELAPAIASLAPRLAPPKPDLLRAYWSAAVLLQQRWRTRFRMATGQGIDLPDVFGDISSGDERSRVERDLQALAERSERLGLPRGLVAEVEAMVVLLMEQHEISPRRF